MGPLENGVLYVRADRIAQVWPSIVTAGWSDHLKGARKLEVYGQRDDPRIVALESAIDFASLIGPAAVEARMRSLSSYMKRQLSEVGGVIKCDISRVPTKQAYDSLWDHHRISIAMTASGDSQGLRFSPHIYNSREEIDRAVAAVKALAG